MMLKSGVLFYLGENMINYKNIDLADLAFALGLQLSKAGTDPLFLCPNGHKKPAPHLQLFRKAGNWKCHNCGESGNAPALVQMVEQCSFEDALSRLAELFPALANDSERIDSSIPISKTETETEPEKVQCRSLFRTDKENRFRWFPKSNIVDVPITEAIVNTINTELKKAFTLSNLNMLQSKGLIKVIKKFGNLYLAFIPNKEGNCLYFQGKNGKLIVVEGRTDFISACEIWAKDGYSILSRYNKVSRIDAEINSETLFVLDKDDDFQNICNRIESAPKTVYVAQPELDLSAFLFKYGKDTRSKIAAITGKATVLEPSHLKHKIFDTKESQENMMKFLNSFCGFDAGTGRIWVDYSNGGWKLLPVTSAQNLLSSYKIIKKTEKGTKTVSAFKTWLEWEGKRLIHGVVFERENKDKSVINTFRGFPYIPMSGKTDLWDQYVLDVLCKGDQYRADFIHYFLAATFQFHKIHNYLILQGLQGTGKSFFTENVAKMLGEHAFVATEIDQITNRFNFHMVNKLFCYLEEAFFGGDAKTSDTLKSKITSPTMAVEIKGGATFTANSYINYCITTNHDNPAKIDYDDRRVVIFRVSDAKKQDKTYFGELKQWLEDGGYSLLTYKYLNAKIEKHKRWNFDSSPEKRELIEHNMDTTTQFWMHILDNSLQWGNTDPFGNFKEESLSGIQPVAMFYDLYLMYCKKRGKKIAKEVAFYKRTKQLIGWEPYRGGLKNTTKAALDLQTCIENFNKALNIDIISLPEQGTEPEPEETIPF